MYPPSHSRATVESTYELAFVPLSETLLHLQNVLVYLSFCSSRFAQKVVVPVKVVRAQDSKAGNVGSSDGQPSVVAKFVVQEGVTRPAWFGHTRERPSQLDTGSTTVLCCPWQAQ